MNKRLLATLALTLLAVTLFISLGHAQTPLTPPVAVNPIVQSVATNVVSSAAEAHPIIALIIAIVGSLNLVLTPISEAVHQFILTQPTATQAEAQKISESNASKWARFLINWLAGINIKKVG